MKPETRGKMMVAMLVSLLAFGCGTGTVLITGSFQPFNSTSTVNTTAPDLPPVYTNQNSIDTDSSPSTDNKPSSTSGQTGGQSNGQTGGQSNGQTNGQNNPDTSSGNGTNP